MARSFAGDLAPLLEALDQVIVPKIRGGSVDTCRPHRQRSRQRAPDFWRFTRPRSQVIAHARAASPSTGSARSIPQRPCGSTPDTGLER